MTDDVSNRSSLGRRTLIEMSLGFSHQCNGCGKVFLQYEDGCPDCGSNASVSLLQKDSIDYEELNSDDKDWYTMFFDDISDQMFILSANAPQEVRLPDDIEKEFVYWIVVVDGEPRYVFLGGCSYLKL